METYINELPNSPISALRLMPSSASEVARFSKKLIQSVKSGDVNPLELTVQLHALAKVYELVREEIEDNILKEADKYPEKIIERYGARIERSELGTKYNYEVSHDIEWEQLNSELETTKRRKAERETFLKSLKEPLTLVNPDTGEVYNIMPPFKTSKSGIKIYLK